MKHDPEAAARRERDVCAARKRSMRDSYARDIKVQQARYIYELHLAQGDALMAFNRIPTQAVVDDINHIFALWRTT